MNTTTHAAALAEALRGALNCENCDCSYQGCSNKGCRRDRYEQAHAQANAALAAYEAASQERSMTTNRHKAIAMERMAARALEQRSDAIELLKSGLGYGTGTSTISEIEVMEREAAEIAKLSIPQQAALAKMTDSWQSAYESQTNLSTLRSLASKGFLVFRHQAGAMAFPRTGIEYRRAPRTKQLMQGK